MEKEVVSSSSSSSSSGGGGGGNGSSSSSSIVKGSSSGSSSISNSGKGNTTSSSSSSSVKKDIVSSNNNNNNNTDKKKDDRKGGMTDSLHQVVQNKKILPTEKKTNITSSPSKALSSKTATTQEKADKTNSNNNSNNNNSDKQKSITSFFTKKPEGKPDTSSAEKIDARRQSHATSKASFAAVKDNLPVTLDNVKVLNFGAINVSSSFHSPVQIYPVNYKCEIVINTYIYTCEITSRNDKPYFTICNNFSSEVYTGNSEAEVWENVTLIEDKIVEPSFFNLKVELLIEGMDSAIDCKGYKFHNERGYGTLYKTDSELYHARLKYLQRELTKLTKLNNMLKPQPSKKDEEKRKKEAEKEEERRKKEAEKEEKIRQKELLKSETKEQKEKRLQENKAKTVFRREITTHLKKVRQEVASLVTKEFDNEQDEYDQMSMDADSKFKSADHDALRAYFDSLPQCNEFFDSVGCDWADILKVASTLQILKEHMKVPISPELSYFVESLKRISSSSVEKPNIGESDAEMVVDKVIVDEEEWDGSYSKPNDEVAEKDMSENLIDNAIAELDRIHLHITKILSTNLGSALDLIGEDGLPISFPINQLTWIELARMSMLLHIVVESGENKDDYPFLIRGGKQMNYRSNKNICRAIRYRFTVKLKQDSIPNATNTDVVTVGNCNSENKLLSISVANDAQVKLVDDLGLTSIADKYRNNETLQNEFNDDEDQLSSRILSMSNDENEPDIYRRCCKVFLKIFEMNASKYLLWEYGGGGEENDYYEIIKTPIAFCDVASNIISKRYGSDDKDIVKCFYRDMLQVPINCITYNSEQLVVVAQAQKLIQAIHRHMDKWLLNSNIAIEACDSQHCLLSGNCLTAAGTNAPANTVKCGRCSGIFCLSALDGLIGDVARNPTFCLPTPDVMSNTSEEWVCVFCLKEDSSKLERSTRKNIFYIDEWGPSTFLPWLLNRKYTNLENIKEGTIESTIIEGLKIMVDSSPWTFADHIKVLVSLCDTLKFSQSCIDKMNSVQSKFLDIIRFIDKNAFQEAEFTKMIKGACGDGAFTFCREMIKSTKDSNSADDIDDSALFLLEGRCSICRKDTNYDTDQTQILLCDCCNGDTHMECAGLTSAPKKGFYCEPCASRSLSEDNPGSKFDIDNYRDFEAEQQLQERALEIKLASDNHDNDADNNMNTVDDSKVHQRCAYCKLTEVEVCSPFVIGQCREEHDAYISMQSSSTLEVPYFPLANDVDSGLALINEYKAAGRELIIVHELCALNMFQTRLNLNMYKKRKLWSKVAENAIHLSGIHIQSLGKDDDKREYWKFPNSDFIFVCCPESIPSTAATSSEKSDSKWKILTKTDQVQAIIDKLGCSLVESKLAHNLIESIKNRNILSSSSSSSSTHAVVDDTNDKSDEVVMESDYDDDNDPFELRLLESKGQTINKTYSVPEESVFPDDDGIIDEDNQPYIVYDKKKIYYAIALLNIAGKVIKVTDGSVTVRYLIHKDDGKILVGETPLIDQWHSDNLYYFSVPIFKRTGDYTVSFIAEGKNVATVKPLVFKVQVKPTNLKCGMSDAIDKLNATQFINNSQRQFRQADLKQYLNCISTELDAVKCALFSVYCALPTGSVILQPESEIGVYDVYECITEATGWNDYLDQAWKGMVQKATTPAVLMECTVILEHFINKDWLKSPQNRLLNALPNFHFALRCASLSSIALRIYCLDHAIDYKKLKSAGRESRTSGRSSLETVQTKPKKASPPQQRPSKKELDNFIDDEDYEEYTLGGRQRSKRAASTVASSKLKKSHYDDDDEEVEDFDNYDNDDDDDDDDDDNGRRSKRGSKTSKRVNNFIDDEDDDDDGFKRRSSRKKTKVNYRIDDNDDKDESNVEEYNQAVYEDIDFEEEINNIKADTEIDDAEKKMTLKCMEMLSILYNDKNTSIFWAPVDTNQVTDYLEVIKEPIDLGTITRNLRLGVYGTDYEAFTNDVRKVWNNCTTYNFRGSGLNILGAKMKSQWETLVANQTNA